MINSKIKKKKTLPIMLKYVHGALKDRNLAIVSFISNQESYNLSIGNDYSKENLVTECG